LRNFAQRHPETGLRRSIKGGGLTLAVLDDLEEDGGNFKYSKRLLIRVALSRAKSSKREVRCGRKERTCAKAVNAMLKRITIHLSLLFCILSTLLLGASGWGFVDVCNELCTFWLLGLTSFRVWMYLNNVKARRMPPINKLATTTEQFH
jgi:hypothetical protein